MKILKEISENEMVVTFLQAEVNSTRFGSFVKEQLTLNNTDRNIIDNPDLSNEKENILRHTVLQNYRGFGSNKDLFENFPENIKWFNVSLTKEELAKTLYIDYDYWVDLSSGTRSPLKAAENVKNGITIFNVSNDNFIKAAEFIKSGGTFVPMIFVSTSDTGTLVNLEGHLRLTAYFLAPDYIPNELICIVGISKDFDKWGLY